MKYLHQSIKKYLHDLGARTSAPGGGSSAALALAMAAGLLVMVCRFTLGKEKYRTVEKQIKKILVRALILCRRAGALLDEDVRAYKAKDMKEAIRVPKETCLASYEAMGLADDLIGKGNRSLVSDAALAAFLAEASFKGGLFYVEANVRYLKDKPKKYETLIRRLRSLSKKARALRKKIEVKIGYSAGR